MVCCCYFNLVGIDSLVCIFCFGGVVVCVLHSMLNWFTSNYSIKSGSSLNYYVKGWFISYPWVSFSCVNLYTIGWSFVIFPFSNDHWMVVIHSCGWSDWHLHFLDLSTRSGELSYISCPPPYISFSCTKGVFFGTRRGGLGYVNWALLCTHSFFHQE